ncbi:hypothetical protein AAFF_G00199250 [Aldrovandia affinis]|uniref:Uncharacterized protein n=1 Tax=Aldrovandia affinis TaxID=143900 RepID=A0AAD7W6J1_9TELE|nr:hypothetical protein AAFF_G00199250 [Aldrovandia affinis]
MTFCSFTRTSAMLYVTAGFITGMLVDSTGQHTYVFYACSASVSSAALFLMASFYWLDRQTPAEEEKQAPPPPTPGSTSSPRRQYRSVPTGGEAGLERVEFMYITSV